MCEVACPFHDTCRASLHRHIPVILRHVHGGSAFRGAVLFCAGRESCSEQGECVAENLETLQASGTFGPDVGCGGDHCSVCAGGFWDKRGSWAQGETEARSLVWEVCAVRQGNRMTLVPGVETRTGLRALSEEELQGNRRKAEAGSTVACPCRSLSECPANVPGTNVSDGAGGDRVKLACRPLH